MFRRYHIFTIIELLVSIAIIAILAAILLPNLTESQGRARFIRWVQFNKQCSADPTCVVNLNFQEGEGDILQNSAKGYEGEGFNAADYCGIIQGDYEWGQGRWWKGKKALQFDGTSTLVEFDKQKALDFNEDEGFTIIIWVKFDRFRRWDGLFSKSWMAGEKGWSQYDLYYDGTEYSDKEAVGQFEVDIHRTCVGYDDVLIEEDGSKTKNIKLDKEHWFMLTLRNKIVADGKGTGGSDKNNVVDTFFNGKRLACRTTNNYISTHENCEAKLIIGALRFLVMRNGAPTKAGKISNFFKGKVDEFLIYRRTLSDREILDHYVMGAEHL